MKKSGDYKILIRSAAEDDITDIIIWYESKVKGLGLRFLESVNNKFVQIRSNPLNYSIKFNPYRMALIEGFPYKIWFKLQAQTIIIISVIHAYRDDDKWLKRR